MILEYLLTNHMTDCINILKETDILNFYPINIDFMKLFEVLPDVGNQVLCRPIETLEHCDSDIMKAQQTILEDDQYKSHLQDCNNYSLKRNVHARFFSLPVCPELHRTLFPKNVDLGCFLKVTGTIVRVTQSKMLEYNRKYVCVKCKYDNLMEGDFEHRYVLRAPTKCQNTEKKCKSTNFTQVNLVSREYCKDYQEIKIQEQVNKLSVGTIPASMWVVLEDDLVDSCKPGDDIHVCGTLRRRWRPSTLTKKLEVELVFQANHLEVCNVQRSQIIATAPDIKNCFDEYWSKYESCPLKGRDQILSSVCPQVYGLHLVKLALLLTVITGSNHVIESESDKKTAQEGNPMRVRGQCHLLLVGDPGTGKSQLLRAGADMTPRSVFTTGTGSTRAGLTCAALREDGEWQLEAGALVLSDGGVCCIDEIGQLREHDRTSIHEAMEQQTISIAKAGIVCKLNTRCAVIAACNPKGQYETDQPLSVNVSLGTPLLSRFDLIFILLDSKDKNWDKLVSSYILFGGSEEVSKKIWSMEKLQMYISLVGPRQTKMTKSANKILQTYYMAQRKANFRDPSRTTVRMLDSLVRLSQAHCRLMYRDTILTMDAIFAVSLTNLSMQDCSLNDTVNALHSTFPKYPDHEYLRTAKKLLYKLNLIETWKEELLFYAKILKVDHKTLENEIDNENSQIFAKFANVTDDNIPLSATLITSSYFNGKKDGTLNETVNKEDENEETNKIIIDNLTKYPTVNKNINQSKALSRKGKRKKKEMVVETSMLKKKAKLVKKSFKDYDVDNDSDNDANGCLEAVPSVNDVFNDLGIDFNFPKDSIELQNDSKESTAKGHHKNISKCGIIETDPNNLKEVSENNCDIKIKDEIVSQPCSGNLNNSKVKDKLQKFKFVEKHDLSKLSSEKIDKTSPVKVEKINKSNSNISTESKKSLQSSQLSIFESSDCDIDLDL